MRTLIISDVSLGYGTPQVLRFANSFGRRFGGEILLLEPDQSDRPYRRIDYLAPGVSVQRLYTSAHPYTDSGIIDFTLQANQIASMYRPDVFVGVSPAGMRVCATAKLAPHCIKIFYSLEDAGGMIDDCIRPRAAKLWHLAIFPEENRARIYGDSLNLRQNLPTFILFNTNDPQKTLKPTERNGRFFYGGLVHSDFTLAKYFPTICDIPIDIYGNISGNYTTQSYRDLLKFSPDIIYKGYLRSDSTFFEKLSQYAYSIVGWMPMRDDYLNAAPNKLFDAIACGVPPIAAPHPQCVEIIRKWKCGLLLDDWSQISLQRALSRALRAFKSSYYADLVGNCRRAMHHELGWEQQFEKVVPTIERLLARPPQSSRPTWLRRVLFRQTPKRPG